MSPAPLQPFGQAYTFYQTNRSGLRKIVRTLYLQHAASFCKGRTLDFGCGTGELLSRLPPDSMGLEINPYTIQHCQDRGLPVGSYDPTTDCYRLDNIAAGRFETLVISHVLEHLDDPDQVLRILFSSCKRLGIARLVMIVPGARGFASDSTHKSFITKKYLQEKGIFDVPGVKAISLGYFPINLRSIGNYFPHHEMTVVFAL